MNHGSGRTLPDYIRGAARLRAEPLYWAKTPDELTTTGPCCSPLFCNMLCTHTILGQIKFLPCFWPHMIIFCLGPASCCCAMSMASSAKEAHWIITANELVRTNGSASAHKSVSWNSPSFSEVVYMEAQDGCGARCSGCWLTTPAPIMRLAALSYNRKGQPQFDPLDSFYGCPREFYEQLLNTRDAFLAISSGGRAQGPTITAVLPGEVMDRAPDIVSATVVPATIVSSAQVYPVSSTEGGGTSNTKERLAKLEDLKRGGIITESEYQAQRQAIIQSI